MSKIFDNIETKFEEGLHAILTNVGGERADFCVGYFNFNLRKTFKLQRGDCWGVNEASKR